MLFAIAAANCRDGALRTNRTAVAQRKGPTMLRALQRLAVAGLSLAVGCSGAEKSPLQPDVTPPSSQESSAEPALSLAPVSSKPEQAGLQLGMAREAVTQLMDSAGTPIFRIKQAGHTYECAAYSYSKPYYRYFFVFRDQRLVSLLDPNQFHTTGYRPHPQHAGSRVEYELPWDTGDRLAAILSATTMTPQELSTSVERLLRRDQQRSGSAAILPAFVLTAPLVIPYLANLNSRRSSWAKKFDPASVKLGFDRRAIEARYGSPIFVANGGDGLTTRAYGPTETINGQGSTLGVGHLDRRFWTAVVYQQDTAIQILNNDLFNVATVVTTAHDAR